jgi:hypothetical protein
MHVSDDDAASLIPAAPLLAGRSRSNATMGTSFSISAPPIGRATSSSNSHSRTANAVDEVAPAPAKSSVYPTIATGNTPVVLVHDSGFAGAGVYLLSFMFDHVVERN